LIGTAETNTSTGLSVVTAFAEPPLSLNYLNRDGECAMTNEEIDPSGRKVNILFLIKISKYRVRVLSLDLIMCSPVVFQRP